METHMDEPCDICGVVGIVDALFTCYVCKISRQHYYCMKIFTLDVPMFWRCEECEDSSEMLASQSVPKEDLPKSPRLNSSGTVHQIAKKSRGINTLSTHPGRARSYSEKWVDRGKTKYIPCREAIKLSSGSRKLESPLKIPSRFGPGPSKPTPSKGEKTPIKPNSKVTSPKITTHMVKETPTFGVLGKAKHPTFETQINAVAQQSPVQSLTELKENKSTRHPKNDGGQVRQPLDEVKDRKENHSVKAGSVMKRGQIRQPLDEVNDPKEVQSVTTERETGQGVDAYGNGKRRSSNAEERNLTVIVPETEMYSQSLPSRYAYWKGSFKLPDGLKHLELNNGFYAYPPSKVRLRLYEHLKKMPELLDFELVPRFKVLTDLFENVCPDKDDVGLYFFPENSKSSETYSSLLEFIWTEKLVLRSCVKGVELFVLTSRAMHKDSQQWEGNYYLWGVFRHVKMANDNASKDYVNHESNIVGLVEAEEMDTDDHMNGSGLASPQPLQKQKAWGGIPPGFEGFPRPKFNGSLREDHLQNSLHSAVSGDYRGNLPHVKNETLL